MKFRRLKMPKHFKAGQAYKIDSKTYKASVILLFPKKRLGHTNGKIMGWYIKEINRELHPAIGHHGWLRLELIRESKRLK